VEGVSGGPRHASEPTARSHRRWLYSSRPKRAPRLSPEGARIQPTAMASSRGPPAILQAPRTMPDDAAFIRAIAAAPDDDAPRLVYADYLEETGDPAKAARAEFIRVQIEKARLVPDTPRWTELWHRDTALLEWARQWRAELPIVQGVRYWGFIRGFVEKIDAYNADQFVVAARTIFDSTPVRRLWIDDLSSVQVAALVAIDRLSDVCELELEINDPDTQTLDVLSDRGPWSSLRHLGVFVRNLPDTFRFEKSARRLRGVFRNQVKLVY
jgi:uncharacterized protein (TIGR02996 family)